MVLGFIKDAGNHCVCAYNGHKNEKVETERPQVKSMFTKTRKEEAETPVERKVIEEEEIEIN